MVKCKDSKKLKDNEEKKKVLQISQEIEFVQKLADNDVRMRDRAVKKLKRWLQGKTKDGSAFTKEDLLILWRGLFYCMWNSDKPLVQEELCENMASLIHSVLNDADAMLFVNGFLETIQYEWTNLDNFRIDKYKMLVRRILRQIFLKVSKDDWKLVTELGNLLWENILNPNKSPPPPIGLAFHISEIYFQEVAKCSGKNELTEKALLELMRPFVRCFATNRTDKRLQEIINESVFGYLIDQSDVGIEQFEKIHAWKMMGCPAITLDQIEKNESDEEDDEEMAGDSDDDEVGANNAEELLDPRAGQMDVELPQINFDANKVAEMLEEYLNDKKLNSKTKCGVKSAVRMFRDLAKEVHPKPFEVPVKEDEVGLLGWKPRQSANRAAAKLIKFEEELMKDSVKVMKKNKSGFKEASSEVQEDVPAETPKQKPAKKSASPKLEEPPMKKRRKRSSLGLIGNWEITEVTNESANDKVEEITSPSNIGNWNVSSVNEQTVDKSISDWEKPLQDGEYEFFVAPKKSPKRKSLYKAPSNEEIAAEQHSPERNGKENISRSPLTLVFNAKTPDIESPKSSRPSKRETQANELADLIPTTPVSALRKARVSMPLNTRTPESTPGGRKSLLIPALTNSAKKKVCIRLEHNKAQEVHEYVKQLRASPHNPHDGNKKPVQGLLKGSPVPFKSAIEKFKRHNQDIL